MPQIETVLSKMKNEYAMVYVSHSFLHSAVLIFWPAPSLTRSFSADWEST